MTDAPNARRERGSALVVALVTVTLVVLAALAVGGLLDSRRLAARIDERDVRLAALSDAAMAATLAHLTVDPDFPGLAESSFGGGTISSSVRRVGLTRARVEAEAGLPEWRAETEAEVLLGPSPSVLSWQRRTVSDGSDPGSR